MAAPTALDTCLAIVLPDLAATASLARNLAGIARCGDVIALGGGLGAGKTAFARAFIEAVANQASAPREEVPSPTFTLVQSYAFPRLTVHHFDLYRLARPEDSYELGIEDALVTGACLIEWPEMLGWLLPRERLDLVLQPASHPGARMAEITPHGDWVDRLACVILGG